jgi:crossover junction endodeoxyribonuclease RuvC
MIILGIDPGTRITGYGIVTVQGSLFRKLGSGVINTTSISEMHKKLKIIHQKLTSVMVEFQPDICSIETAFYGKNIQSTLKLGHVRGVALLTAALQDVEVAEYSPREVKRAVTGSGAAAKQQVAYMVNNLLKLKGDFKHSDEADGLALALCHAMNLGGVKQSSSSWEDFIRSNPDRVKS